MLPLTSFHFLSILWIVGVNILSQRDMLDWEREQRPNGDLDLPQAHFLTLSLQENATPGF